MKKGLTIGVFNTLPLKSQQYIISELLLHSSAAKTNDFLPKINNLMIYLLQFKKSEKSKFIRITIDDEKCLLELNENCQIQLLDEMTEILFRNKSLDSSDFINIMKEFKEFSIEIKYPSKTFQIIYDSVLNFKKKGELGEEIKNWNFYLWNPRN